MVFSVETVLVDELKKPAVEFRVKDLFDARAFNTTRIEIARGGQTITLEKEKGKEEWKQLTPAAKPADAKKVESLLTALTSVRATSFVDKIAGTGLENPDRTVSVAYEDGQKHEKVAFARTGSDTYARRYAEA